MAEGILGGILSEQEEEKPEVEGPDPLVGTEAFAAAVAVKLSGNDPAVARETAEFLRDQQRLLKIQAEHLVDEHALRIEHLRSQLDEEGARRFGFRVRLAFQLFVALVATVLGLGVLVILRDAFTSHRVVIEPFRAPPGLAARGIDGSVIAGGLLDELARLQDATRSSATAYSLSGAWGDNIKLEVTDTGISLAEVSRLLRERFGHDVHIEGDLVETLAGGLALTVRGNGVPPKKFSGSATELDKLTVDAAAYVYSMSQPARWAAYLVEVGRNQEAIDFCSTAYAAADLATRVELYSNTWANALENVGGSLHEALNLYLQAAKLKPDLWRSYSNIMNTYMLLGREEEAWRTGVSMLKAAGGRPGKADETNYANWDLLTFNLTPWLNLGAWPTRPPTPGPERCWAPRRWRSPTFTCGCMTQGAAELTLKTMKEDPRDPMIGALSHFVRGRLAADAGDVARAGTEMQAFAAAYTDPNVSANYPGYQCWIAPAEDAAGHPTKADALLAGAGSYVDCYRFRADILDARGNWVSAQKAYAEALALAPDLPAAYYSWGLALERHGDLSGAAVKFQDANARGPGWADPLKGWGDVLIKQGRINQALAKYQEALKYAPNWQALKEAATRAQRGVH